jgi:hypothetical protein
MRAVDILGSLLKHLIQRTIAVPEEIRSLYKKHIVRDTRPTPSEISEILLKEACRLEAFYVVVDALDECGSHETDGDTRAKVLNALGMLQPNIRVMLTGRPHIWEDISTFKEYVTLNICARDEDIKSFIEGQIDKNHKLAKRVRQEPDLTERIKTTITDKAKGM